VEEKTPEFHQIKFEFPKKSGKWVKSGATPRSIDGWFAFSAAFKKPIRRLEDFGKEELR